MLLLIEYSLHSKKKQIEYYERIIAKEKSINVADR
jgi:hypothetical protein